MSRTRKEVVLFLLLAVGVMMPAAAQTAATFIDTTLPDCGLQKLIDEAARAGGGTVKIPEGVFALRRGLVLRDGVEIVGAGIDKTILTPARKTLRLDVTQVSPNAAGKIYLRDLPADLDVGSAVTSIDNWPLAWHGVPRPGWVRSVDRAAKVIVVEWPYGSCRMVPGKGFIIYGDAAAPERDIRKGDTEVVVRNANLLKPGDEITFHEPPNESMEAEGFIKEIKGNTLVLEEPARRGFAAWPDARTIGNKKVNALHWVVFPMVHGMNVKNASVRDLTVQGQMKEGIYTTQGRYTVSGLHVFNGIRCTFERVAVRDWPADGLSLQTGDKCVVRECAVTGCLSNGLHPGTGLTNALFENCLAEGNGAGLYFCWHNRGHVLRNNRFVRNRGGGITGLGNPGDRNNIIEGNLIAENGGPGIEINGGIVSGNVIRNNIIENNSKAAPGKSPGIALYASTEDALDYTITGNTIRDTQEKPTQWIGIEERAFDRKAKNKQIRTRADQNIIRDNAFSGHKTDIVLAGPRTVAEDNGQAKVEKKLEQPVAR